MIKPPSFTLLIEQIIRFQNPQTTAAPDAPTNSVRIETSGTMSILFKKVMGALIHVPVVHQQYFYIAEAGICAMLMKSFTAEELAHALSRHFLP
ncbi:MAG: hypothetical protein C4527_10575 [Candidatus Omnitrophota bacterium]|nr:MAG: hypothetical protein C4527_10575 [Candidatus Omnitrophota bacterium]